MNGNPLEFLESFRAHFDGIRFWDQSIENNLRKYGEAMEDSILQSREEVLHLCGFIKEQAISSYLEIGIWTGGLISLLDRIFPLSPLAACDHGWAEVKGLTMSIPPHAQFLNANSDSEEFVKWRESLGMIDLVFIDGDHRYGAVKRDFEINRAQPHRFLAFHDFLGARPQTRGVGRFWNELREGYVLEIQCPHPDIGLRDSVMGIGIWSETRFKSVLGEVREAGSR